MQTDINANIHTHKKNTHERERLKTMKQSPHIEVEKAVESIIFISIIFLVKSLFLGRHVFVVLFKRRIFMVSCLFSFKCQCLSDWLHACIYIIFSKYISLVYLSLVYLFPMCMSVLHRVRAYGCTYAFLTVHQKAQRVHD